MNLLYVLLVLLLVTRLSGELAERLHQPALVGELLAGIALFAVTGLIGRYVLPRIGRLVGRSHAEEFELSALLILALGFALLAGRQKDP